MHSALVVLLRLHGQGMIRQIIHDVRRPRAAVVFAWAFVGIATWIGPRLLEAASSGQAGPEMLRVIISLSLLGICLTRVACSCTNRAACFSRNEVEFLFTGPFTRRELLTYKLAKNMAVAALTALVLAAACRTHVVWPVAAHLGFLLAIVFVQLVSMALALIAHAVAEGVVTRVEKFFLIALLVLIALSTGQFLFAGNIGNTVQFARHVRESWPGYCLFTVFDVFARTVTAESSAELTEWGVLALTIDLVLFVLVTRLPVYYMEASISARRADHPGGKTGAITGVPTASCRRPNACQSVPLLPWLGGAGPIAWRQLINLARNVCNVLWLVLIMAASVGPVLVLAAVTGHPIGLKSGSAIWLIMFVPALFPFDFRSDMEHMDWLKALPLRSAAVAIGQLATPVVVSSLVQLVLAGGLVLATQSSLKVLLIGAAFALPLNLLLFSIENIVILLLPDTVTVQIASGFDTLGRQLSRLLVKVMLLALCYALALVLGGVAYLSSGESVVAFWITCWLAMALFATAFLYCVAWAYPRFN